MLAALIIVFREVLEAGIVSGVVLAASQGIPQRGRWIGYGVAGGVLGSLVIAVFAREIANLFDGSGQELLNATILAVAVIMLVWTVVWMASHGRQMAADLKALGREVQEGRRPLAALAIAVGMAVLREGAEVVLFLYGILASGDGRPGEVAVGGIVGILLGVAVSFALYRGLVAIPVRYLFKTTGTLIALLAAGLAAQSVGIVQGVGFLQELSDPLWDSNWLLAQDGPMGRVLHSLVGYTAEPTGMQVVFYAATLVVIVGLSRLADRGGGVRSAMQRTHRGHPLPNPPPLRGRGG